jgi:inner membrane protein
LALTLVLSAIAASHGVLDALTDGGRGIAFFAPFDSARHFFPWRPIPASPLGARAVLSPYGARVVLSEAVWIGLPSLALFLLGHRARRKLRSRAAPTRN